MKKVKKYWFKFWDFLGCYISREIEIKEEPVQIPNGEWRYTCKLRKKNYFLFGIWIATQDYEYEK